MKKTKIIKILQKITENEWKGKIIIPLTPISINSRSNNLIKKYLNDLIGTKNKILKKKEKELLNKNDLTILDSNLNIQRSFDILVNDISIPIIKLHAIINHKDQDNINEYLTELMKHASDLKYNKVDAFIFEYIIRFEE